MDLAERLEALKELNERPLPERASLNPDLMDEEMLKEYFLELVEQGEVPDVAARKLNKTAVWFKRRRSEKSMHYDPEFAERYEEIKRPGGVYEESLSGRALAALVKAAEEGNVRAIEKILMRFDPSWSFLRPAAQTGDVNIENFIQLMPGIPTPVLEQIKEHLLEQRKMKELPVIDAA